MKEKKKVLTIALTVVYAVALVWIILFKASTISEIANLDHLRSINLIPFYYDREVDSHFSEVIWNIIIFVPLGIYLKMLEKSNVFSIIFGVVFSLLLEIAQFIFAIGASDITDLMMNTLGAVIGVLIYNCLDKVFKNREKLNISLIIIAIIGTILFAALTALLFIAN